MGGRANARRGFQTKRHPVTDEAREAMRACIADCLASDAPLPERLARLDAASRRWEPDYWEAVEAMVARLRAAGVGESAPVPGEPMPFFALPDEEGRLVTLDGLIARGPALVAFFRGHWCPYCRVAIRALARAEAAIGALGARVAAVMPERAAHTRRLKREAGAWFPVLTDAGNGVALNLAIVYAMGEAVERLIARDGIDVPSFQARPSWLLPLPAMFVVDAEGFVTTRFVGPDHRRRPTVERILEALAEAA
jgi:peroxiredoxin